jgi:hypothetical protein
MRFSGVLATIGEPSDLYPEGSTGHRLILTRESVDRAIHNLIGSSINFSDDLKEHDYGNERGIIDSAVILEDNTILVKGYLTCESHIIERIFAIKDLGMSFEAKDAWVEDMRSDIWVITNLTFIGAAVVQRKFASYKKSSFCVIMEEI